MATMREERRGNELGCGRVWPGGVGGAVGSPAGRAAGARRVAVRVLRAGVDRGLTGSGDVTGAPAGTRPGDRPSAADPARNTHRKEPQIKLNVVGNDHPAAQEIQEHRRDLLESRCPVTSRAVMR